MILVTLAILLPVYFTVIRAQPSEYYYTFKVDQTGLFLQENPAVNSDRLDYKNTSLGLINREYKSDGTFDPKRTKTQWERFENYINYLNNNTGPDTQYKLIYAARHAEGWHNVAGDFYPLCWNCYWSQEDGNGTVTWRDAALTPKGLDQMAEANRFWKTVGAWARIPFPQIHYISPLTRTLQTATLTWADNPRINESKGFYVKEALREGMYQCTCSARSNKTSITERFPLVHVEADMTEEDTLWKPGFSESDSNMKVRAKDFLNTVFSGPETIVSATSHGMFIRVLLEEIGYPNAAFRMRTSQNIPLLVRADKISGKPREVVLEPPRQVKQCNQCQGFSTETSEKSKN